MKILMLNQAFYPDVVSTAQHAGDLAQALVNAGNEVTVIASRRGYDDPQQVFPPSETWRGVRILRVGSSGLGKGARWRRAADFATFMASCAFRALLTPRFDLVIAMTSPPLISVLGALLVPLKAHRFVFWCMDLNPDEAIAAGWLRQDSTSARLLCSLLRFSLHKADAIIALDRFMQARIEEKGIPSEKVAVVPPWSHDNYVRFDPGGRDAFRRKHGLEDKFVVMYSGNHSPCHPLDTLMEAARRLSDRSDIVFCFVGGGSDFRRLERCARENGTSNLRFFPYQPLQDLAASLSAADLHVVVMGDVFVGIVHPCKVYNVLAVGAPFLYIGPAASHVGDLLSASREARSAALMARHGDVEGVVRQILAARSSVPAARVDYTGEFTRQLLLPRIMDVILDAQPAPAVIAEVQASASREVRSMGA
jgi:colanic acid biosynthesis glycosyl transferase WcaI